MDCCSQPISSSWNQRSELPHFDLFQSHLRRQDDIPVALGQEIKLKSSGSITLSILRRRRCGLVLRVVTIVGVPQLVQLSGGLPRLHVLVLVRVIIISLDVDVHRAVGLESVGVVTVAESRHGADHVEVCHLVEHGQACDLKEGELRVRLAPLAASRADGLGVQVLLRLCRVGTKEAVTKDHLSSLLVRTLAVASNSGKGIARPTVGSPGFGLVAARTEAPQLALSWSEPHLMVIV